MAWGIVNTTPKDIVDIAHGGTGATTAAQARQNLGAAASSHTHDDRYYTEAEVNNLLNGKAASSHTHDDRYYTESEVNAKLNAKANSSHTHDAGNITSGIFAVGRGGTGASTASQGLANLGGMPKAGGTFTGTVYFGGSGTYIKTDGTAQFTKALGAAYNADYAEFLPRGEQTQPGDIVALDTDSPAERYLRATNRSRRVAGVHTDECAMLIGGNPAEPGKSYLETNLPQYIPVALAGRVRVRVMGPVHTGDIILPSEEPGVGRAAKPGDRADPATVVGYAVEGDDRTDIRRLRVRIGG